MASDPVGNVYVFLSLSLLRDFSLASRPRRAAQLEDKEADGADVYICILICKSITRRRLCLALLYISVRILSIALYI